MQLYTIRQIDKHGGTISDKQVEADSAQAALRELRKPSAEMHRLEVYDANQKQVRQVLGKFWRANPRR
jgi:type II secretory pathway component PulF